MDYDEEIEAERALSRRLTHERYGDSRWWSRKADKPRPEAGSMWDDSPLMQARRRRALGEIPGDDEERRVSGADS